MRQECRPRFTWLILAAICVIHGILVVKTACSISATYDEPAHLAAGISYFEFGQFGLYRVNPPLPRLVAAAPLLLTDYATDWRHYRIAGSARREFQVGADFAMANREDFPRLLVLARLAMLPFTLIGLFVCYLFSKRLWGTIPGLLSAALWGFSPFTIGHAALITTDIAGAATGLLSLWRIWEWQQSATLKNAFVAGTAWGLAMLCKSSFVLLPAIWLIAVAVSCCRLPSIRKTAGLHTLAYVVLGLFVLNAGYGFCGFGTSLGDVLCVSENLTGRLQGKSNCFSGTVIGAIPVPMPEDFIRGIDLQKYDFEKNVGGYLHGEFRDEGHWYFILYALAIKLSLPTLSLALLSTVAMLRSPQSATKAWIVIVAGVGWLLLIMTSMRMDDHSRYALPAVACLFVLIGAGIANAERPPKFSRYMFLAAACVLLVRSALTVPNFLSHTNALASRDPTSFHFSGSDLVWGENLIELREWCVDRNIDGPVGLLYSGCIDPEIYGVHWSLSEWSGNNSDVAMPEYLFVSSNLACAPYRGRVFNETGVAERFDASQILPQISTYRNWDAPSGFHLYVFGKPSAEIQFEDITAPSWRRNR